MKAQYAILRFAKYKGPEIGHIEAHNERTKEKYASNPDVDTTRSQHNFHLVIPERKYRAEAEKQIAEAGCRTRSDSVRVVEALVTASPEFFKGKKRSEVRAYFTEALEFIKQNQNPDTIISAVVHMDEKTPHMHLCFVPLTEDKPNYTRDLIRKTVKEDRNNKILAMFSEGISKSQIARELEVSWNTVSRVILDEQTRIKALKASQDAEEAALMDEPVAVGAEMQTKQKMNEGKTSSKMVLNNIVFYGEASSQLSLSDVQPIKTSGNDPPS